MKNLISLVIGLSFLCNTSSLSAQCRCTVEQLKTITQSSESIDPIVGLYILSSDNFVIDSQDEISSSKSQNLSSWIIVPDGEHFKVCHTEFTSYEKFEARIYKLNDGTYLYKSKLSTDETVIAQIKLNQNGLEYTTQVPPKKYNEMYDLPKSNGTIKLWAFQWRKIDITSDYNLIADNVQVTSKPTKVKNKKVVLNSEEIIDELNKSTALSGYQYLENQSIKSLIIKDAFTTYPGIQTIVCSIANKEFEVDVAIKSETLISIRPVVINRIEKINELSKYFRSDKNRTANSETL